MRKQQTRKRSKIAREFRLPANVMHEEAWEDDGPNMKLSRAFIVVLALHIVAVASLIIFNLLGDRGKKVGGDTKLPEKPVPAVVKQQNSTPPPTAPSSPILLEGMSPVKVEKHMSTALFAQDYGLSEDALLEMNKHTPLVKGALLPGETVYVPDAAKKRSSPADLPTAPVVSNTAIEPAKPVTTAKSVLQPTPPAQDFEPAPTPKPKPKAKVVSRRPAPKPKPKASGGSHKVRKGETLYRIATNNGVSVKALMRANGLSERDAARLRIGRVLKIPR